MANILGTLIYNLNRDIRSKRYHELRICKSMSQLLDEKCFGYLASMNLKKALYTENSYFHRLLKERNDPNNLNEKLKNLNADEVSTKAKDTLSSIEEITQNLPKKLDEAKKLYENRRTKRKASAEAMDFGRLQINFLYLLLNNSSITIRILK